MAHILVIDDDPAILSVAELVPWRDGQNVVVAREAKEGLRTLQRDPFDLVIVDIFMPEIVASKPSTRCTACGPDCLLLSCPVINSRRRSRRGRIFSKWPLRSAPHPV